MKNKRLDTRKLRYVFYILLTCVLYVGCKEEEIIINNYEMGEVENKNTMIGIKYLDSITTGCESNEYGINYLLDKTVRFKNGNVAKVVGGTEHALLLQWESGSVTGFGDCDNIVEILHETSVGNVR
jgi:hypothetical protein